MFDEISPIVDWITAYKKHMFDEESYSYIAQFIKQVIDQRKEQPLAQVKYVILYDYNR